MRPGAVKSLVALARQGANARKPLEREVADLSFGSQTGAYDPRVAQERRGQQEALRDVLEKARELDEAITRALGLHDDANERKRRNG